MNVCMRRSFCSRFLPCLHKDARIFKVKGKSERLQGSFLLQVNFPFLLVLHEKSKILHLLFHIPLLRRYSMEGKTLAVSCGSRCGALEGWHMLETKPEDCVYDHLVAAVRANSDSVSAKTPRPSASSTTTDPVCSPRASQSSRTGGSVAESNSGRIISAFNGPSIDSNMTPPSISRPSISMKTPRGSNASTGDHVNVQTGSPRFSQDQGGRAARGSSNRSDAPSPRRGTNSILGTPLPPVPDSPFHNHGAALRASLSALDSPRPSTGGPACETCTSVEDASEQKPLYFLASAGDVACAIRATDSAMNGAANSIVMGSPSDPFPSLPYTPNAIDTIHSQTRPLKAVRADPTTGREKPNISTTITEEESNLSCSIASPPPFPMPILKTTKSGRPRSDSASSATCGSVQSVNSKRSCLDVVQGPEHSSRSVSPLLIAALAGG